MGKINSVVLLSGGMDSCVTAAIALEDLKRGSPTERAHERIALLHVSYGQRTAARERRAFDEIADFYQVRGRLVADIQYLKVIGGSALTDGNIRVPTQAAGERERLPGEAPAGPSVTDKQGASRIPITYVPFRNTHLLSIAVSWAETLGAGRIYIGAVAEDSSGYPDCRPEYYKAFNQLIQVGTRPETDIEVVTPVIGMTKSVIVQRGIQLGAPLHLTWSCYQNEDIACGICESCALRRRAFEQAGCKDPMTSLTAYRRQEALRAGGG